MTKVDLIVVGQGLAGSVLVLRLLEEGFSVLVIDKPELSLSSKVAAGIWNPVVFKRLTKSWMIDAVLPEMLNFYRKAEKMLGAQLITERNIIKVFSEQQEADLWIKKSGEEMKDYLDSSIHFENIIGIKTGAYGYSRVLHSGNLDVPVFLNAINSYLKQKNSFLEEKFDHGLLKIQDEIVYKDIHAQKIIFAEGHLIRDNPFFSYVPMKPAKGETVVVRSEQLGTGKDIINKNAFVLPLQNDLYKVGATYDWTKLNDIPSDEGREELMQKLKKISGEQFELIEHRAGVRPSVIDRRPVIGVHPKHRSLFLFNGMGTKGVMLAPYFAGNLVSHLKNGTTLEPEVSLSRFDHFFVN